jgi:hypothetical protein
MSGRRSRDNGARTERAIVKALQAQGIMATKISGMYRPGAWLDGRDVLIVKADRQEPLVVLRMSLAAEIAQTNHPGRAT